MKLDQRDVPLHRGGSSDGGGGGGAVTAQHVHSDHPTTINRESSHHQEVVEAQEAGDLMASKLSHLDRMANWREVWNPRLSMSLTSTKGLMNAPGDNNCFLNSAVQVLWHLDVFRRSFRLLSGHACMGNSCIFCALKVLFTQFQYSDRSTLPPNALRKALACSFQDQHRFQLGHMDDAAECFENILTRIHFHIANGEIEDKCKARHCIPHVKFAMNIVEQIACQCGATTDPLPFTQMVHYVSASALVSQAKAIYAQQSESCPQMMPNIGDLFAQLLRNATAEGDIRPCPKKCGENVQIRRTLVNCPDVVSIGLIWDSDRPTLDHIKDVVRSIGTTIRLPDLFHSVSESVRVHSTILQLVGVVCYYGKHYSTFFFHSKMNKWVYFDDAHVKEMGPDWNNVADKCCRGHYQPLLLLYTNQNCEPIDTQTAPDVTTRLPGYQHFNSNTSPEGRPRDHPARGHPGEMDQNLQAGSQYMNYETSLRQQSNRQRRSMTPGPDQHDQDSQTIPRRAITPGPEWGRYNSEDEDETDGPSGAVHFRQSSYLQALDAVPREKVHRSKTATHGGDPYYNAQRENYRPQANGVAQSGKQIKPVNQHGTNEDRYREDRQSAYQPHNSNPQGQTNGKALSQSKPANPGGQYQYIKPQTHPPVPLKPKPAPEEAKRQPPAIAAKPTVDYQDWTLSTSEPYRRQNMPKSPVKEAGFVFPTSPTKTKAAANMAKVNEIQRLESFKKGKGKIGVDVVRYQVRPTDKVDCNNPYGPLEPEALYPGNESGVMQTPNKTGQMPNSQSHPALKAEANQNAGIQSNLKRTRSLENTNQPEPVPVSNNGQIGNKLRPQSARPFEHTNPNNPPPPTTPKLKRPSNVHPGAEGQNTQARTRGPESGMEMVDGKPPRPISRGPGYKEWKDDEDPYGTLSYINRKAVESILFQQQKSGAVNSRVRTLSQGPGSAGSRSSNSSLESCTEQLNRTNNALPQRPALPEALRVEIPGDNLSLGSQKDSGYRSGSSGDRNSASSMSSVSVDSPVTDGNKMTHPHHQYQQRMQNNHQQQHQQHAHPYQHQQTVYASADAKSHSSTDSLSSGQSGQSYATIKASSQNNLQPHLPPSQQSQQYLHQQQQQRQLQQQQQMQQKQQQQQQQQQQKHMSQTYQHPQFQTQTSRPVNQAQPVQQHGGPVQGQTRGHPDRNQGERQNSRVAGDECDSICFQAESLMEESNQKEKESDFHTAMILCQKAIGCLQQVMNYARANSETKAYARMKYNTCLLRSRSLHRRIIMRQEGSDLSAEDHTSVSSQSTDTDIKDVTDSPQHYYHHPHLPPNASYEQQYSSDSGYSSHSVDITRQSQMSHSNTDGAIAKHLQEGQKQEQNWNNSLQNDIDSREADNKSIEIYATLPRKKTAKNKAIPTQPLKQDSSKETAVYQSYLERQKAAANQDRHQRGPGQYERSASQGDCIQEGQHLNVYQQSHQHQQYAPQNHQHQQQVYHARQTSNSKMNKEQIKQLLINDFMARKEGKGKEEKTSGTSMQGQGKQEHERIRNVLYNELTPQLKNMGIKDSKRAQSELNLHQMEPEYGYQSQNFEPQPKESLAMGYMVHPDSRQAQTLQSHHSRESSCSSTTTIKAHSRENSLSSPPLSPKQNHSNQYQTNSNTYMYQQQQQQHHQQLHRQQQQQQQHSNAYGYQQQLQQQQQPQRQQHHDTYGYQQQPQYIQPRPHLEGDPHVHRAPHPEYVQHNTPVSPYAGRRGQEIPTACLDRDRHPPKPSMIGKLDKMLQQQQQQQQQQQNPAWAQHVPENGWAPQGAMANKGNIRKSTSHQHIYDQGQADWTARSEGDVSTPLTIGKETSEAPSTDLDESFPPPPPPDLFQYEEGEESFPPPPPPELLEPYYQPAPAPTNQSTCHQVANQDPRMIHPANQQQGEQPLPPPPAGGDEDKKHTSVSKMVANFEQGSTNTVQVKKSIGKIKMRTHRPKCTFSTFFAPPQDQDGSGDRSSLSSVESTQAQSQGLVLSRTKSFESEGSSNQNSSISSKSNTDCEGSTQVNSPPKRPKSALRKKKEGRPRRKSVSFSDNVALVVDQEEMTESQGIDYIQYVSKVLEQSKNRSGQPGPMDNQCQTSSTTTTTVVPGLSSAESAPNLSNGYDSDFDEDTGSSASSTNGDSDQIRCNLCGKKVVEVNEVYCVNCKFYMSRFQPTDAS